VWYCDATFIVQRKSLSDKKFTFLLFHCNCEESAKLKTVERRKQRTNKLWKMFNISNKTRSVVASLKS